ncbi:MAG: stage III sporulation protein AG [Lachnospiraceae bacterium]|nr:stage III sporulation protein AG [Lachnospiraceae bacterium]
MSDREERKENGISDKEQTMKKWEFSFKKLKKMKTETWVLLLLAGILLLVVALPTEKKGKTESGLLGKEEESEGAETIRELETSGALETYVRELEKRVEEFLSTVEGAGATTVFLTVESGGEIILQTDTSVEQRSTNETDSEGGVGISEEFTQSSQTVLFGNENTPYVTKELCPKVTGIVVVAEGGDNARVKAEISGAMEALFDVPPHKIKVLKRVKEES